MNTSLNNGPFQRFIYKSFSPYKPRMFYPRSPKFRKEHKTIIDKGVNQNLSQSFIYSKPNQNNNFTNLSTINRFGQNIPNIANNSSYNYSIDSNQSKSSINNSYIANPIYRSATYKSTIQPNIYPNINILPTKYIGTKVYIPKIINYNEKLKMNVEPINFGYTRILIPYKNPISSQFKILLQQQKKLKTKNIIYQHSLFLLIQHSNYLVLKSLLIQLNKFLIIQFLKSLIIQLLKFLIIQLNKFLIIQLLKSLIIQLLKFLSI